MSGMGAHKITQNKIEQDRFCSQHRTAVVSIQNDPIKRLYGFGGNEETDAFFQLLN
jgi:Holliday junction resolvasome RuvABC DNA-binding subunit